MKTHVMTSVDPARNIHPASVELGFPVFFRLYGNRWLGRRRIHRREWRRARRPPPQGLAEKALDGLIWIAKHTSNVIAK